jgi:hypothetical protein
MKIFILLIIFTIQFFNFAYADGYGHDLYLCDLGIKNANSLNQFGVDFIQYFQNAQLRNVFSTNEFSTVLAQNIRNNSSFDRWSSTNAIENVSINLESDFYGSQYFLEYCYNWERIMPTDNLNYEVSFLTMLRSPISNTQFSVDTICSLMANNGVVTNEVNMQSNQATLFLSTDYKSMRCTIKLNFKEDISFATRPHNGGDLNIDPVINVKVNP